MWTLRGRSGGEEILTRRTMVGQWTCSCGYRGIVCKRAERSRGQTKRAV